MKTKQIILGALLAIGLFTSCDAIDKLTEISTLSADDMKNESKIDAISEDLSKIAEDQYGRTAAEAGKSTGAIAKYLPDCATVSTTYSADTWIRVIDFGTTGCALANGNIIKGKITIRFAKSTTATTKTISYTLENFYHNDKLIVGNKNLEFKNDTSAALATAHPILTHNVDMTVTFADGKIYKRTGTIVKEQIEGLDTPTTWADNVYAVSGNTTTILPTDDTISNTITSNLIIKATCNLPYPVKGSVTAAKNGNEGYLDFGDGPCDNIATYTIKGIKITITL